jgi:hypothetical protein
LLGPDVNFSIVGLGHNERHAYWLKTAASTEAIALPKNLSVHSIKIEVGEAKMRKWQVVVIVAVVAVVAVACVSLVIFPLFFGLKLGYTEIEGFLEFRAYPKISEIVPTVMVYVLIPQYDHDIIYLTERGLPLSALEGFSENDLVTVEGVLYSRDAVDMSESYWMIEMFTIALGD